MAALAPPKASDLGDKLARYLRRGTDVEYVINPLVWWTERRAVYLNLSCMALDYLTIPGKYWIRYFKDCMPTH